MKENSRIWDIPTDYPELSANEVHVWRASLEEGDGLSAKLEAVLSTEERERAGKFFHLTHRQRWIIAHALLRILLGKYLHVRPETLEFCVNDYGKPALAKQTDRMLHFNISHSEELVLFAFAYERELGVDVEYMRKGVEYQEIARSYFSPHEQAALKALPKEMQEAAFFHCWSRKEAYIKARARGLSIPLGQFDVSLHPDEPAELLASREEERAAERWKLHTLWPGDHYAGALAVEGRDWGLRCWQWDRKKTTLQ